MESVSFTSYHPPSLFPPGFSDHLFCAGHWGEWDLISAGCSRRSVSFTEGALEGGKGWVSPTMESRKSFLKNQKGRDKTWHEVIMEASSWPPHWQQQSGTPNILMEWLEFRPPSPLLGLIQCAVVGGGGINEAVGDQRSCGVSVFKLKFNFRTLVIEQVWVINSRVCGLRECCFLEGSGWSQ